MPIEELSELALIKISGEDAADFLQGQLSNDVNALAANAASGSLASWQYSAYCNPKGRTLALFHLWRDQDDFLALLSADLVEPICKRLRMYVMRSKVQIEHLESAVLLGVWKSDDNFWATLSSLGLDTSELPNRAEQDRAVTANPAFYALSIDAQRLLVIIRPDSVDREVVMNKAQQYAASPGSWRQANILAGIPEIFAANSEQFIPQMINLDLLGAINFKKGCYTGQEIVARMHYLGNLKQRMYLCEIVGESPPAETEAEIATASAKIYANADLQKAAGQLLSTNVSGSHALAVLRIEYSDQPLFIASQSRLQVVAKQPYAVST